MNDIKTTFYKTLNIIVGTNRVDNKEAYVINDILEYFKQDNIWIEYCKLNQLFMEEYDTCLLANVRGSKNE